MASYFSLGLLFFINGGCFAQNLFFNLEKENATFKDNHKQLISNQSVESQTSCFLNCLNHEDCCVVEIKILRDEKWVCKLFQIIDVDWMPIITQPESNIFSTADPEGKCKAKYCMKWFNRGFQKDGVYKISINGKEKSVFCDMTTNGGGWTVFQRRINGHVDFRRTWEDYKNGFGDVNGEHWLGNELTYEMTDKTSNTLIRIEATDFNGVHKYIIFKGFSIESETNKYRLNTGVFESGYASLAGDWTYHDRMNFTTIDRDNDQKPSSGAHENCAVMFSGGWWFLDCYNVNPNNYYSQTEDVSYGKGMTWYSWHGQRRAMKTFRLSIK